MGMTSFHIFEVNFTNFPVPLMNYNNDYKIAVPSALSTQQRKMSGSWATHLLNGFSGAVSPAMQGQDPLFFLMFLLSGMLSPPASSVESFS